MSVTVSVRLDENEIKAIEEMGLKPGEFIKELVRKELKKRRALDTLEWLRENLIDAPEPDSTQIIRELRDSRWA